MSLSSKINYAFEALSGITVGNINITGNIFQNNNPYIASQWTSTSGNALTYTSGNVIISNGSLVASNLTTGNINFTGTLSQNGSPYIGSQWTGTSGTLYYGTAGSSVVGINTTAPIYTLDINGTLEASNANGLILFASTGNLGIGTTVPSTKLDVVGTGRITTSLTTGALYSTNQTTTNIVGTTATITNLNIPGTLTVVNITSTNLVDSNITATNLRVTGTTSVANIYSSLGTISNVVNTNLSTSTLSISSNMVTPRIDIGGTQSTYNNNTLGKLFITGGQNSVTGGPNILITTTQDNFPTYNFLTYGHDSSWTMYDMYFDGSFRNSGTATAFMMVKESSTLKWNYNTSGFSAGATAPVSTSICIGSSGNVGLGGQVTPAYTLDVTGTARISSGLTAGASTFTSVSSGDSQFSNLSAGNINFTGNLFQNGSAYIGSQWVGTSGNIYFGTAGSSVVGINTTSPSTTLDVSGTIRASTSLTTGALYSTNQTTTNIVSTNLSTGTLNASTISTAILTASTSITTGTIRVTGNADLSTGLTTVTDLTGTNITSGTIRASTLISTANLATNNFSSGTIRATTLITSANITTNNFTAGTIRSTNILTSNITTSNIIVNGTSTSTNSSSGSVVLQGGLSIDEPTNATSVSNGGALTIAGGAAIAGDLIVGGSILYSNAAAASSTFAYLTLTASDWSTDVANGSLVVYGGISVQNTANATSASSGNGLTIAGGAGIGADLYVGGVGYLPNIVSTTNTTTNLVATGISASNINVSGTLTVVNITSTNLAETNITTATIQATTGITSAALLVTGLASTANLTSTTSTLPNMVSTNVSTGTIRASTGITSAALLVTGLVSTANIFATTSTIPNTVSTNVSTATIRASTGITSAALLVTGLVSAANVFATTSTIPNIVHTNITTTSILVTNGSIIATFNSNTLGNVFTTGGNVGIGTTSPAYNLDVVGSGDFSTFVTTGTLYSTNQIVTNLTSSIIQATGITTGTIRVTGNADLSTGLTTVTDLTGTNQTTTNIIVTNLTSSIIQATGITTGTIRVTNAVSTNISTATLRASTGITSGALLVIGLTSTANLASTTSTLPNMVSTNITVATLNSSTGITTGTIRVTGNADLSTGLTTVTDLTGTNQTITNIIVTNLTSSIIQATGITTGTIRVTGNADLSTGLTTVTDLTGTNISSGTIRASTLISTANLSTNNLTATNLLATASTITNLSIPGTLTVVNITSTNLVETNISAATILVSGGGLSATFNSNTIGSIFTTGGNVGIGTVSPAYTLDVTGSGDFSTFVTTGALYSTNQTTTNIVATNMSATGGTIGILYANSSRVGINTTSPLLDLDLLNGQFGIRSNSSHDHLYFLVNGSTSSMRAGGADGGLYIDINGGASSGTYGSLNYTRVATFSSRGNVGINNTSPSFNLDVSGTSRITTSLTTGALYSTNQTTTNIVSTAISSGNVIVNNNLNISGISSFFGGSFSANNNVTSASTVTSLLFPSATVRSFIATLNINISKPSGNLNSTVTLEGTQLDSGWILYDSALGDSTGLVFTINSSGQILYTSPNYVGWVSTTIRFEAHYYTLAGTYTPVVLPTSGNVSVTGVLSVNNTSNATSTSSGALTVSGGAGISKSLLVGENLNVGGLSNTFTGSFAAANNVAAATNVTGFLVPTATFSSFTANLNVRLLTTTTTLNAQYMFEATQSTGGWLLNDSSFGDAVGITFTITSTGQIQYTSTNVANWQSTTINFAVNAISISSGFTAVLPSSGNVSISGNLTIDSTTDSSSTSSASLVLAGGAGINKSLLVGGNFNIGGVTTQFAGTFSGANSASGASVTGLLFPTATIRSFTCTLSVRVVSSVNYNTQHTIEGIQTAGSGWQINDYQIGDASGITFNINSSGQITYTSPTFTSWTSTTMHYNAVAYNISSSYTPIPMPTGGSSSVAGSLVIQSTNIASSTSSGALSVSGGVGIQNNLIVGESLTATFNSNTIANIFTTGGNVGINNTEPSSDLDISCSNTNSINLRMMPTTNNFGTLIFGRQDRINRQHAIQFYNSGSVGANFIRFNIHNATVGQTVSSMTISDTGVSIPLTLSVTGNIAGQSNSNTIGSIITTGGNVGIGTTSPSTKLQINGNDTIFTSVFEPGSRAWSITNPPASNTTGSLPIVFNTNNAWDFKTDNISRLFIEENGNLGIGTTNPSANLEISSTNVAILKLNGDSLNNAAFDDGRLQTQIQMRIDGDASGFNLNCYNGAGNNMFAIENITNFTSGAIRLYIDGAGDIGLGTTNPVASLDFGSIASSKKIGLAVQTTNFWGFGANSSAIEYQVPSSSAHRFYTGSTTSGLGTERVCISSTGSLLVNETSSLFGGDITRFHVKDDASANWIAAFNHNGAGTASNQAIVFIRANTQVGSISIGGGATAYNTTSDYRLKKNITPITNALSTLEQINPVSYQWTADDSYSDGFVAHELKEVYPQAVTGEKDELYPDGSIKPQSVDYSKLVALLTAAIKELKQEFDEYKQSHP